VIPNPILDLPAEFTPSASFPKTAAITFGCHGSPLGVKNVQVALSAFCRLESSMPGSRLLVFGGGWEQIGAEFSKHRIEFRGAVPHHQFLKSLVEEVDVWVHPSKTEAHPGTICEAIQAGCAVIAGKQSGGVPWTLDYGRAGLLVDIDDADDVARAMRTAVCERTKCDGMLAYGRRLLEDRCNPERILDLHLQYYRDVSRGHNHKTMT